MATAATDTPTGALTDICGYCLDRGDNPRVFPCSHVFCTPCLKKYLKETKVLKCGKCRTAYDKTIDDLPSVNTTTNILCQSCERKGVSEHAVVYCKECDKKFCSKHEESHEDMFGHDVISIDMYLMEAGKLQPRYCKKHSSSILSLACEVCNSVLCNLCLDGKDGCTKNFKHQPVSLNCLAGGVRVKVGKLKAEAQEKEGELAGLMKQSTRAAEDIAKETEQLREFLHKTRDEQIGAIREKYDELETQLLDLRQRSRAEVTKFIEKDVGVRLDSLSAEIQRLDAYVRDSHEVDLIDKFSHFEKLMKQHIDVRNPSLVIQDLSSLELKSECRDIELKLVQSKDSAVLSGSEVPQSATMVNAPPTHITVALMRKAVLSYGSSDIHVMNGTTYAFSYRSKMSSIGVDGTVTHLPDVKTATTINGVTGCNGEAFLLNHGNPWEIVVVDTRGNFLRKWNHDDNSTNTNQLTAVGGTIVVPNFSRQQLTVYSVTGEIIRNIPCRCIGGGTAKICSCGTGSVIITVHGQTSVSRVNIISGQVVWTTTIANPRHVACWRNSYVLVVDADQEISVLDAETGKFIKRLPVQLQGYDGGGVSVEEDRLAAVVNGGIRLYKIE